MRGVVQAAQERMANEPGVEFRTVKYGGGEGEVNVPLNAREDAIVLYIHGGGLICGNAFSSRGYSSMLAGESKFPVYTLTYRLASENPFPAAVEDCFAYYRELVGENLDKPIFLIGESGGARRKVTRSYWTRYDFSRRMFHKIGLDETT